MTITPDGAMPEWQRSLEAIMAEAMRPTQELIATVMEETTRPMRESIAASINHSLFAGMESPLKSIIDDLQRSIAASLPRIAPLSFATIDVEALLVQARRITEDVEDLAEPTDTDAAAAEPDRQKAIAVIRQRIEHVLEQLLATERWVRARLEASQEVAGPYKDALDSIILTISGLTSIYVWLDKLIK